MRKIVLISIFIGIIAVYINFNFSQILLHFSYFFQNVTTSAEKSNTKLFTAEELRQYNGSKNSKGLYISIFGYVYDVHKGKKHYGPGKPYHVFTGRDASRAFITGEFSEDKLSDHVLNLSLQELKSLNDWRRFYNSNYKFKGFLIGRYFDQFGKPTEYTIQVNNRIKESLDRKQENENMKLQYPPCNAEWNAELGTRVWCTKNSGGVHRNWVGVPRKFYEPGLKSHRCACVQLENSDQGNLKEYSKCHFKASSCYVFD